MDDRVDSVTSSGKIFTSKPLTAFPFRQVCPGLSPRQAGADEAELGFWIPHGGEGAEALQACGAKRASGRQQQEGLLSQVQKWEGASR